MPAISNICHFNSEKIQVSHEYITEFYLTPEKDEKEMTIGPFGLGWKLKFSPSLNHTLSVNFHHENVRFSGVLAVTLGQKANPEADYAFISSTIHVVDANVDRPKTGFSFALSNNLVASLKYSISNFPCFVLTVHHYKPLHMGHSSSVTLDRIGQINSTRFFYESLEGKPSFVDTKFWVFSGRSNGKIGKPMAVFANSAILKSRSNYFETLLGNNGFFESKLTSLDAQYPLDKESTLDDYDESDSDLDDESDNLTSRGASTEPQTQKGEQKSTTSDIPSADIPSGLKGRTIFVEDAAYRTWRCLIFYLYTNIIEFAPLKSRRDLTNRALSVKNKATNAERPAPCSPKSMYRLADKLGLDDLKEKAFKFIKSQLTSGNIIKELFSSFTSRYEAITALETKFFIDHHQEIIQLKDFNSLFTKAIESDVDRAHIALVMSKIVANTPPKN